MNEHRKTSHCQNVYFMLCEGESSLFDMPTSGKSLYTESICARLNATPNFSKAVFLHGEFTEKIMIW